MTGDEVIVGIDLGTTNSEVACVIDGQPRVLTGRPTDPEPEDRGIVPSVVGLDDAGELLVGVRARNQLLLAPERTIASVKRRMGSAETLQLGERELSPPEISALILTDLQRRAERALSRPVNKAVITVPAYFTDAQRQATREAGALAGLEVVRILNEPTAAALAHRLASRDEADAGRKTVLVYDLGGGTFDVSVVSMEAGVVEVMASTGDQHLGGDDFDERLVGWLIDRLDERAREGVRADRRAMARLRRAAESAKARLSVEPVVRVAEDHLATLDGRDVHLSTELHRHQLEALVGDLLGRTIEAVSRALDDASVRPSQLDRIDLVGGSTRMPLVAQLLRDRLGQEPHGEIDPDLCVALGAAIEASVAAGEPAHAVLVDVTPYTFGTSALDEPFGEPKFFPIIRRNTKLPATRTELFSTLHDEQRIVNVKVFQGESSDPDENVELGSFEFDDLNSTPDAFEAGVLFTCHVGVDGILEVRAVERATGRELRAVVEGVLNRSTDEQVERSRQLVASIAGAEREARQREQPPVVEGIVLGSEEGADAAGLPSELAKLVARASQAAATAAEDDRADIEQLVGQLTKCWSEGSASAAEKHATELDDILFYLS